MNDLTVAVDLSLITDAAFWASVATDGGDIRATDSTNTTILPIHLANFNSGTKKGVLYVKSNGNGLRLWSGTGLLSQPSQTSVGGSASAFLGETSATDPYSIFDFSGSAGARLISQGLDRADFDDFGGNAISLTALGDATFTQSDSFLTNQSVATKADDDEGGMLADTANVSGTNGTQATYEVWYKITAGHDPMPFSIGNYVLDPATTPGTYASGIILFQAELNGSVIEFLQFTQSVVDVDVTTTTLCSATIVAESESVWHHLMLSLNLADLASALVVHDGVSVTLDDNSASVKDLVALPFAPTSILGMRTLGFQPGSMPASIGGGAGSVGFFGHYRGLRDLAWAQARYNMRHSGPDVADFSAHPWPN